VGKGLSRVQPQPSPAIGWRGRQTVVGHMVKLWSESKPICKFSGMFLHIFGAGSNYLHNAPQFGSRSIATIQTRGFLQNAKTNNVPEDFGSENYG
jgi:hypothetical protein